MKSKFSLLVALVLFGEAEVLNGSLSSAVELGGSDRNDTYSFVASTGGRENIFNYQSGQALVVTNSGASKNTYTATASLALEDKGATFYTPSISIGKNVTANFYNFGSFATELDSVDVSGDFNYQGTGFGSKSLTLNSGASSIIFTVGGAYSHGSVGGGAGKLILDNANLSITTEMANFYGDVELKNGALLKLDVTNLITSRKESMEPNLDYTPGTLNIDIDESSTLDASRSGVWQNGGERDQTDYTCEMIGGCGASVMNIHGTALFQNLVNTQDGGVNSAVNIVGANANFRATGAVINLAAFNVADGATATTQKFINNGNVTLSGGTLNAATFENSGVLRFLPGANLNFGLLNVSGAFDNKDGGVVEVETKNLAQAAGVSYTLINGASVNLDKEAVTLTTNGEANEFLEANITSSNLVVGWKTSEVNATEPTEPVTPTEPVQTEYQKMKDSLEKGDQNILTTLEKVFGGDEALASKLGTKEQVSKGVVELKKDLSNANNAPLMQLKAFDTLQSVSPSLLNAAPVKVAALRTDMATYAPQKEKAVEIGIIAGALSSGTNSGYSVIVKGGAITRVAEESYLWLSAAYGQSSEDEKVGIFGTRTTKTTSTQGALGFGTTLGGIDLSAAVSAGLANLKSENDLYNISYNLRRYGLNLSAGKRFDFEKVGVKPFVSVLQEVVLRDNMKISEIEQDSGKRSYEVGVAVGAEFEFDKNVYAKVAYSHLLKRTYQNEEQIRSWLDYESKMDKSLEFSAGLKFDLGRWELSGEGFVKSWFGDGNFAGGKFGVRYKF